MTESRDLSLRVRGLRRTFGEVIALDGVDLDVARGEFVTLLGPSGCGKTTLLRTVAGFEHPDEGSVEIAGHDVLHLPPERRPLNLVFQRYALFPHLNVWRNVAFGLEVAGTPKDEVSTRVGEALDLVRLHEFGARRTDELSGGQQQRVALARAIVNQPEILLLDEPLGALDLQLRTQMQFELRSIHRTLGSTFIYVTHDQEEALRMSDRIVVMRNGQIEQQGAPQDVYLHPRTRFVARFIGETNLLDGREEDGMLRLAGGSLVPLSTSGDTLDDGVKATISIRPEHVGMGDRGLARLSGEIEDSIFLGPVIRHAVRMADGISLTVHEQPGEGRLRPRGELVEISWDPADAEVLVT